MSKNPDLAALFGATDATTFLGLSACTEYKTMSASSAFIGAPGSTPYGSVGSYCRNAPEALRKSIASLTANIHRYNFDLGGPTFPDGTLPAVDCGDLPLNDSDFALNRATIRSCISQIVSSGVIPILIGGDDSVPIPMLDAMADTGKKYTILQIDAHIDWRESHMDESLGLSSTMRRASEMAHINRIIQVGARGIGSAHPEDVQDAIDWGVKFVTAYDVHVHGVQAALTLLEPDSNIIVCLDVDAFDPSIVPGVIGRTPGGLTYFQMLELIKGASSTGRIAAIDFVEYLPEADVEDLGGLNVSRLIASTMGVLARQQAGTSKDPVSS